MAELYPKILAIESGLTSSLAQQVVDRVKAGSPDIEIVGNYKRGETRLYELDDMPRDAREHARWLKNKQTLILRDKQKDYSNTGLRFVHPFLSVEKAREGYQFALSVENECPLHCEFCYLQGTLKEQPVPTIYANFQDREMLVREIKISLLGMHIYTQIHGIQANITRAGKVHLSALIKLLDKTISKAEEDQSIADIFQDYKAGIRQELKEAEKEIFEPVIKGFSKLQMTNLQKKFHFNNGDLNDGLAYEHITGNSEYLVSIFSHENMRRDGGQLLIRTKMTNVDSLIKLDPNDNVIFSMTLGTKHYSKGTPNSEKRIEASAKMQKRGYRVRLDLDPIIQYTDTFKQYKHILDSIKAQMDWQSPRLEKIILGMLRFNDDNIEKVIRDRHTDLYGHYSRTMSKGEADEEKSRYDRTFRVNTYKAMAEYIEKIMPGVNVRLSTEAVSVWKDAGLSWN